MAKQQQTLMTDPPEEFDAMTQRKQQELRAWIRTHLEPTRSVGVGRGSFSYGLKHKAERDLGWYVSNGELKGAMLAEGYRWKPCDGTLRNPSPNWVFNSRERHSSHR